MKLQLDIGEKEDGYIDAYYGPPEWQAEAKLTPRTLPELAARAARARGRGWSLGRPAASIRSSGAGATSCSPSSRRPRPG